MRKISISQSAAYLRALGETNNATLAAERAGVSRAWAYKLRERDPLFAARRREMEAIARERLKALRDAASTSSAAPQDERDDFAAYPLASPPLPAQPPAESPSPAMGRGEDGGGELVVQLGLGKRVQVRRARAGRWTPRLERRFIAALAATHDVPLAASSVGMTAPSAYRHRQLWPAFAERWQWAVAERHPWLEPQWAESARCFFTGEPLPPENPVRVTSVDEVRMLRRW